jgi:hypothetical protein
MVLKLYERKALPFAVGLLRGYVYLDLVSNYTNKSVVVEELSKLLRSDKRDIY